MNDSSGERAETNLEHTLGGVQGKAVHRNELLSSESARIVLGINYRFDGDGL